MNPLVVLSAIVAAASAQLITPNYYGIQGYNLAPYAAPVLPAPAVPYSYPSSQYQAQDEFGNVNYGYSNINSAKQEVGNAYGGVTGSYSYVDANGIPQRVDYIADAAGYRVKATNLPVAPLPIDTPALKAPVFNAVSPDPVKDTAEVAEAKAAFQAAYDEALARTKRDSEPLIAATALPYAATALPYAATALPYANPWLAYNGINGIAGYNGLNAYAANYGYAAPLTYNTAAYAPATPIGSPLVYNTAAVVPSIPAAVEAIKTTVKLNPGHAVAYRVD